MNYYRSSVTQKSFEFLQDLKRRFDFVLIGGWAVWLYTKQLKSKDIDVVIELGELDQLRAHFEVVKNERLRKYEIRSGEVEVDVYAPFYSRPGIPAEEILADARTLSGFKVPSREVLLMLKIAAWEARRASAKGRKDFLDIASLLSTGKLSHNRILQLQHWTSRRGAIKSLIEEIKLTIELPEIGLNRHQLARAKKQWLQLLR